MGAVYTKMKNFNEIIERLLEIYPNEKLDLKFENPFELLIASILAAQAKDEIVNLCTEELFKYHGSPERLASAKLDDLKPYISKINFWRRKAKMIIEASKYILDNFSGVVPDSYEKLVNIKGVGSKTANMILGGAFGKPAVIVDTHFQRVVKRLGLLPDKLKPLEIEKNIREIVPQDLLTRFSFAIIRHGKSVCHARKPDCDKCQINYLCKFYKNHKGDS